MRQNVSPVAIAAVVVVACIAIGYFGFRVLTGGGANSGGAKPPNATMQYQQRYQNYGSQRMGSGTPGASYGSGGPTSRGPDGGR